MWKYTGLQSIFCADRQKYNSPAKGVVLLQVARVRIPLTAPRTAAGICPPLFVLLYLRGIRGWRREQEQAVCASERR